MRNVDVTSKITHGMYVLTTKCGGCIIDAPAESGKDYNDFLCNIKIINWKSKYQDKERWKRSLGAD